MLEQAKALSDGKEPAAAQRPAHYQLRGGGCITAARMSFEDVMRQRFGSTNGKVPS